MEDERVVMMSAKGYQQLINTDDGKGLFWTDDMNQELPIKIRPFGPGSEAPTTVSKQFYEISTIQGDKPALWVERDGKVLSWTWKQYQADAFAFAKALQAIGIQERKCINIMGHNAPEWVIAYMGGVCYNAVISGVYPTNNADACLY
jgi:long-chain-fatty-acid--CoA ligase ACSBG